MQFLDDAVAVEFGHHHIAQNQIWLLFDRGGNADASVFRGDGLKTFQAQNRGDVAPHLRFVFDN